MTTITGIPRIERLLREATGLDIDKSDIALARSFKIIDPGLKNPGTAEWERAFALFDLLI